MKYDDGFVAYLNGIKIADRNAPAIVYVPGRGTVHVSNIVSQAGLSGDNTSIVASANRFGVCPIAAAARAPSRNACTRSCH